MSRKKQYSLVLLAGGKSSRMGTNKAELLYQGQTFARLLLTKVQNLGIEKICLSGFEEKGIKTVWDIYQDVGPLGGLHACFRCVQTPYCLVLPVDVPQIPADLLERLLQFHENLSDKKLPVLLEHRGCRENLIGIYPAAMADYIEDRIRSKKLSVHGLLDSWGNTCLEAEVSEWQIENINTRESYEQLLKMDEEDELC